MLAVVADTYLFSSIFGEWEVIERSMAMCREPKCCKVTAIKL